MWTICEMLIAMVEKMAPSFVPSVPGPSLPRAAAELAGRRADSIRRTVATAWQQTVLLHAVDDDSGAQTANASRSHSGSDRRTPAVGGDDCPGHVARAR